jgi:hypothetical protein
MKMYLKLFGIVAVLLLCGTLGCTMSNSNEKLTGTDKRIEIAHSVEVGQKIPTTDLIYGGRMTGTYVYIFYVENSCQALFCPDYGNETRLNHYGKIYQIEYNGNYGGHTINVYVYQD